MTIDEIRVSVVVEESGSEGELVLRLGGELDVATRDAIEPALMAAIVSAGTVIIDLGGVTFCDSTGVAMFIAAHDKGVVEATPVVFRNVGGLVKRVFDISGVTTLFDMAE